MFDPMVLRQRTARIALVVLTLPLVVGLAGAPAAPAADEPEAEALLRKAAETMSTIPSFHFALTTRRGTTTIMERLEIERVEGDIQRPDRFRATITAKAAFVTVDVEVVAIGNRIWISDPFTEGDDVVEITPDGPDGPSLVDIINPDRIILEAVDYVEQAEITDDEEIDGVKTWRVEGVFDPSRVTLNGTPAPQEIITEPMPVKIWIDEEGRVRRMQIAGPLFEGEERGIVRQLDLTGYDDPIDIQPPPTA